MKLSVGGQTFVTSTLTLTRDPTSMLAAMFSGRHALRQDDDGSYFIDRDGTHFRYVLNYLRDGAFRPGTLPADPCFLGQLCTESEYYQLDGLTRILAEQVATLAGTTGTDSNAGAKPPSVPEGSPSAISPSSNRMVGASPSSRRMQRKVSAVQTPT